MSKRRFPYFPPGSPEREQAENFKEKQLAEISSRRQDMADRALYKNRVFDQQSQEIARQKNKEWESGLPQKEKKSK